MLSVELQEHCCEIRKRIGVSHTEQGVVEVSVFFLTLPHMVMLEI